MQPPCCFFWLLRFLILAMTNTPETSPTTSRLIDKYGRHVTYVRMSITDRCDFRCTYCMGEEMTFLPRSAVLSFEECLRLGRIFTAQGVTKLRITGGEPLVRKDAIWLLQQLAALPGLQQLVLTTNGSQLERFATDLKAVGVKRLNVSVDTLNPEAFRRITRTGNLDQVLRGLQAAKAAGFQRTKLNAVMMRGVNEHELLDLLRFAIAEGFDLSLIEEMPLGAIQGRENTFYSSDEALAVFCQHFTLTPTNESSGGPASYWRIPGTETRLGFISPHSHNFCASCNRVRITAQGELYPCLGQNDAVNLLPLLREHPNDDTPVLAAIQQSMGWKPEGHDFNAQLQQPQVVRFMSMTGG